MDEVYNTEDSYENRKRGREDLEHIAYPKRINFGKFSNCIVKLNPDLPCPDLSFTKVFSLEKLFHSQKIT